MEESLKSALEEVRDIVRRPLTEACNCCGARVNLPCMETCARSIDYRGLVSTLEAYERSACMRAVITTCEGNFEAVLWGHAEYLADKYAERRTPDVKDPLHDPTTLNRSDV